MSDMKKYRVYVEFHAEMSTEVMAVDKESALKQVDELISFGILQNLGGLSWDCIELDGGAKKARELVYKIKEVEK